MVWLSRCSSRTPLTKPLHPSTSSTMAAPPRPPSALMDELVEEILLRVPPDDPARLVRAALVCKRWCCLVSDPGFRRRFRLFHRAAPMLGFVYRSAGATRFMPTSSFRPPDASCCRNWRALEALHGRILFLDDDIQVLSVLIVWSAITGEVRRLPTAWRFMRSYCSWNVALLCAAADCDHLDCPPGGPFTVVLVGIDEHMRFTSACVYSSEAHRWSQTACIEHPGIVKEWPCGTLVGNALYFHRVLGNGILEYDLGKKELSVIKLPPVCNRWIRTVLMTWEDGGLVFVIVGDFNHYTWSRDKSVPNGWTQHKVMELKSLLPVSALSFAREMIAVADGVGVTFIWACDVGVFTIAVKYGHVRKVFDGHIGSVIPYMSFCTPALREASTLH